MRQSGQTSETLLVRSVSSSTRKEKLLTICGVSICNLITGLLALAGIITTVILLGILMRELQEVQDAQCVNTHPEACNDGNPCTFDFISATESCAPFCEIRNVMNGQVCASACYIGGAGQCLAGHCKGLCAGSCLNNATTCPDIVMDNSVKQAILDYALPPLEKVCFGNVCWYQLSSVDYVLFRSPPTANSGEDSFELAPHMNSQCHDLLNQTANNFACLESYYSIDQIVAPPTEPPLLTKRGDGVIRTGSCFYRYSCANSNVQYSLLLKK